MRYDRIRFLVIKNFLEFQRSLQWSASPPDFNDDQDRRFYYNLFQGLTRHYLLIEAEIHKRLKIPFQKLQKSAKGILALGVYELLFMDKIPARATLSQSLELTAPFKIPQRKPLINAILRNLQRDLEQGYNFEKHHSLAIRTSHQDWMVKRWEKNYGELLVKNICEESNRFEGITICPGPEYNYDQLKKLLREQEITYRTHPAALNALIVENSSTLFQSKLFKEGACFIQDASSQIFMELTSSLWTGDVMDICASPGGKSIHISQCTNVKNFITNDVSPQRMGTLTENFRRLKCVTPHFIAADGCCLPFKDYKFDAILLDAPCSSTGTIRKNPDIKWYTPEHLLRQVPLQSQLLHSAAQLVKPGGYLIYATCSLEVEENDKQVELFLENHPEFQLCLWKETVSIPEAYFRFIHDENIYRVLPSDSMMGFFGVIFRYRQK